MTESTTTNPTPQHSRHATNVVNVQQAATTSSSISSQRFVATSKNSGVVTVRVSPRETAPDTATAK